MPRHLRICLLVCVPALAQHGDQTVHSTHTRLRRCRRPPGGAGAPGGGYDLRWEDMTIRGEILEGENCSPWEFSGPGTLETDSPEKMLSNGSLESETGSSYSRICYRGLLAITAFSASAVR